MKATIVAGLVLALGAAACGSRSNHTIEGSITISTLPNGNGMCTGQGPVEAFTALGSGSATLKNQDGSVIGTANIRVESEDHETISCPTTYGFTFENVPDANFYVASIGGHDGPTYSKDELAAADWKMDLSQT